VILEYLRTEASVSMKSISLLRYLKDEFNMLRKVGISAVLDPMGISSARFGSLTRQSSCMVNDRFSRS